MKTSAAPEHDGSSAIGNATTELGSADFQRIVDRVHSDTGIVLKPHKAVMVKSRLARRLDALGYTTVEEYLDHLDSPNGADEHRNFHNALTTNLTSFFRDDDHFDHLREELARDEIKNSPRLRLWSAACSTGEEPYSMAMTIASVDNVIDHCDLKILATDLDTIVLDRCRAACYNSDRVDSVPKEYREKFFEKENDGKYKIIEKLRKKITFRHMNLLEDWPFGGDFDFIFCRNVIIYMDTETKMSLVSRLARKLSPGGVLYLGHSEAILKRHPLLEPEGRSVYRRIS